MRLFIFPPYSGNISSFLNNVHILPLRFITAKAITAVIACSHCVFEKSVSIKCIIYVARMQFYTLVDILNNNPISHASFMSKYIIKYIFVIQIYYISILLYFQD